MRRTAISRVLALGFALFLLSNPNGTRADYHPYETRIAHTDAVSGPTGRVSLRYWEDPDGKGVFPAPAPKDTTNILTASWNSGLVCITQGWTVNDATAQTAVRFHVDTYQAISGTQSLWCGAASACGYATMPGYGNHWNQAWSTKAPVAVSGDLILDVAFDANFNSEPDNDVTVLEYTTDLSGMTGWTSLDQWDANTGVASIGEGYSVTSSPVLVRLRFHSDGRGSDEDGLWPSDGAVRIDDLQVEGLALEDFESVANGATSTTDWQYTDPGAYGQFMGMFRGTTIQGNATSDCLSARGCVWTALLGSAANFSCGGFPSQAAVPYADAAGRTLYNEIISPEVTLTGTGNEFRLWFGVYPSNLDNLVFYNWRVRTNDTCPGPWKTNGYLHYVGRNTVVEEGTWIRHVESIGAFVDTSKPKLQLAIGVIDMSSLWTGVYGSGQCHSFAPLFDNVRLVRIDSPGPQWSIREIDQFQDTMGDPNNPGFARADMAQDILPAWNPGVQPGDSSVVTAFDPAGLANDVTLGGKQIYAYVKVWPVGQPNKSGSGLSDNSGRWPVAGTVSIGTLGTWTKIRLDPCVVNGTPATDRYCIDLNDDLFTPGDTVAFFYGAANTLGQTTYAFGTNLARQGTDLVQAADNCSEFTCLPAGGYNRGGSIFYVDGADGRGNQPYFEDGAFASIGLADLVDRFDVRGPSSGANNNLSTRVADPSLLNNYSMIVWDTGNLSMPLAGASIPKLDDFDLLNDFLGNLTSIGGLLMCGSDVAEQLSASSTPGAVTMKAVYMPFTLTTDNHRLVPTSLGFSPKSYAWPGRVFSDNFVVDGTCPDLHDFDVMTPSGTSQTQMTYQVPQGTAASVISNVNGIARVLLAGFSVADIRDDENNGIGDRLKFLRDALFFMGHPLLPVTSTGPAMRNTLAQNYPNPFNPETSIGFSIRERGRVMLTIYGINGERVRTLANEEFPAGGHTRMWDGRNENGETVASGVYFYKVAANGFSDTKKMVLLK